MSCSIQLFTDAEEFFVQFSSRWSFRRRPADFPKVYQKLRAKFIIIGIYQGSYEIRFVIHEQAPFIKEKEIKPCTKATLNSAPAPCV